MAAKKKVGAPRKYKTAAQLEKAVQAYWKSISYEQPAIISTPTGEVDENGHVKYVTKMLTEDEDGHIRLDGIGRPKTITQYLEEPSVAGLCLHLDISKDTWAEYAKRADLGLVCARFKMRHESYLAGQLNGNKVKSVQGVMFNLKNNFGWKDKVEVDQKTVGLTLEQYLEQAAAEGEGQSF